MVNSTTHRRRLSLDRRRVELIRAGVALIATRPWDEVTMTEIAAAAEVSKPLLYHYFSTKSDLYLAAIRAAAEELSEATRPDDALSPRRRLRQALSAHVAWIDANALGYRAILQGGISADPAVQAIVEDARAEVVRRIAGSVGVDPTSPAQRLALRGWVGFLEGACLDWLTTKDLGREDLVELLASSLRAVIRVSGPDAAQGAADRDVRDRRRRA